MTGNDPAEPLLEKLSADVRPLMQELRAVVREAMPRAAEKVQMGYGHIQYWAGASMRDMVIALGPQLAYVNVEFHDGVHLPDPANKLEGTGKTLRHVKVRTTADARTPELRALLEEAARKRGL